MTEKPIKTGYISDISKGLVRPVQFSRIGDDSAWGVEPETGHVTWVRGNWTIGKNLFLTVAEAISDGEAKRDQKIASLAKQLAKLEKMKFKAA